MRGLKMISLLVLGVSALQACSDDSPTDSSATAATSAAPSPTTDPVSLDAALTGARAFSSMAGEDLADCPLGSPAELAAEAGIDASFNDFENYVNRGFRDFDGHYLVNCIARSDSGVIVSIAAGEVLQGLEQYLTDGDFMVAPQRSAHEGGELITECPREQTQGDTPEHCEAWWIAPGGDLVVSFDISGPSASSEAAGLGLTTSLSTIIATLSS